MRSPVAGFPYNPAGAELFDHLPAIDSGNLVLVLTARRAAIAALYREPGPASRQPHTHDRRAFPTEITLAYFSAIRKRPDLGRIDQEFTFYFLRHPRFGPAVDIRAPPGAGESHPVG